MALARWTATAQDAEGNAVAGCSIEVRSEETGRLVQVYADRAGSVALGNPFVAPEAQFGFHVEGGAYKVTATKGAFQSIWPYVAIGTASEFDYDQLIYELQAGLMPVATFAEIDGQAPGVDQSLAAIVLADPDPTRNGYYLWSEGAGQWRRKRPLPDTLARLTVVGGTANALEALASPGVDPGAVLAFFLDVPTANTGPVTLSINDAPGLPVRDVNGDDFAPGVFTGRLFLSNEGDHLQALIGGDYLAAVAAAQAFATLAASARDSSQRWAEGTVPGGAGTKSAREWALEANPDTKLNKNGSNLVAADAWALQPIGVPIPIFTHLSGVAAPPTNEDFRYIKLTASDAYNSGVLVGEIVSGSAPLVQASAIISDADAPLNGQTVRLINTERRVLRAGAVGEVENDQMQVITGSTQRAFGNSASASQSTGALSNEADTSYSGRSAATGSSVSVRINFDSSNSPDARAGNETRPKNIGVDYYMRIR